MNESKIFEMMELELKLIHPNIKIKAEWLKNRFKNGQFNLRSLKLIILPMGALIALNPFDLDLGDNDISELPDNFGQLTNLEKLSLVQNELSELPDTFGQLTSLELLFLDKNKFTKVPYILKKLKKLNRIHLSNNNIENFEFNFPESLEKLFAMHCNISFLDSDISQIKHLKLISMSFNRISKLPKLQSILRLEYISLSNNLLTEFPSSWNTEFIKELGLAVNEIHKFDFTGLTGLREINLGENELVHLGGILDMPNINTISIGGNPLKQLPELNGIRKIITFNLGNTMISYFPKSFAFLANLEYLDISNNLELKTIPDFFTKLKNLKRLHIGRSKGKHGRICIPIHVVNSFNKIKCLIEGHRGKIHIRVSESCEKDSFGKLLYDVFPEYRQQ